MKKIAVFFTVLAAASAAQAGNKTNAPVVIDLVNRVAEGSLGTARNSVDAQQQLECYTFSSSGVPRIGLCFARSASMQTASCFFDDVNLLEVARSLSGDSFLSFRWDETGMCTTLSVYNGSQFAPKKP